MRSNWRIAALTLGGATFAFLAAGCDPPAAPVQIGTIDHDLGRGATGPEVAALNDYLKTYGYYPNEDLQAQYPAWRPIVASAPGDWNVFDANVERAVTAYQKNMGLKQTGVFDAGTRTVAALPRCGVPDGIAPLDPTDKWSLQKTPSPETATVTWNLVNNLSGLPDANVKADISNMLNLWRQYSAYSFAQSSTNPLLTVTFGALGKSLGGFTANNVPQSTTVTINTPAATGYAWSDNGSPSTSQLDLPTTLLHELGHALGLYHSSFGFSVMYPAVTPGGVNRTLKADDVEAIATVNTVWTQVFGPPSGGTVFKAAVNFHFNGPSIWALSGVTTGGYHIWEMNGGWTQHPGLATSIAVNPTSNGNQPWVINTQDQVFRWNWSTQNWDNIPACATDIAVGTDDSVWVIGCDSTPGGRHIYKYNGDSACGAGNCWTQSDGGAVKVSVGQRTNLDTTIVPWLVNSSGQLFRRTTADATVSNAWEVLPNLPNSQQAVGVAAQAGYAYAYSAAGTVYSFDEQPFSSYQSIPAQDQWIPVATNPAAGSLSSGGLMPIMVSTGGLIYTMN
jgi:peptidoglycan hydrolase-like protein with peptidoglycan-binding domain